MTVFEALTLMISFGTLRYAKVC
ncbi:putative holin-like toxin [Paenibacillus alvei]